MALKGFALSTDLDRRLKGVEPGEDPRVSRVRELDRYYAMYPGAAPNGTGATGVNDLAGYSKMKNENVEYLNLKNELAGKGPVGTRFGGMAWGEHMPKRPSLAALRGDDPNDFTARMQANLDPVAPTFEQQRQGRILRDMDDRAEMATRRDSARSDAAFDLNSGAAAARAQGVGDIGREQAVQDARNKADIYSDPKVKGQREEEFYQQMEQLRRRYSDPAIIKGQNDAETARIRGLYGVTREQESSRGARDVQGLRNDGARATGNIAGNARVAASVAGAGADPAAYENRSFDPNEGAGDKTMTPDEFNAWAAQSGLTPQDAARVAQQSGYRIR